ncbi:winged helix DNA-binding protein [Sphingomonas qomolangmaensis]|uniref:Winged helix DNA-binding protein n=1 Tax=Sphingomonas qomolangmaensis TaxID=2918765 RepID=A0ABY5L9G4_9SPHN|nr:winged helix DNA-binding protein [Sphingomonas qomolangmaensis]UUL82444.1 winged helix DNA-binding protein [Sphingomonas qomolangmaensis]
MPQADHQSYAESPGGRDRLMLLVADDAAAIAAIERAAAASSARDLVGIAFRDAAESLSRRSRFGAILVDTTGVADDVAFETLARIDAVARERVVPVIASFSEQQIDLVASQLTWTATQFLCEPGEADRYGAIALAGPVAGAVLREAPREAEQRRLHQLNEEVARIAETLAKLARGDGTGQAATVRDRVNGFAAQPHAANGDAEIDSSEIRAAIRARRMREQFFERELFADPAWDMLLDLFAARLDRSRVSVSSLCIAAAVPPTTALRWIGTMREAGLFERQDDPFDRRRAFIGLTAKAMAGMQGYVAAVRRAGLTIT